MLDRKTENELKVSLTQIIDTWWDKASEKHAGEMPLVGGNISEIMAAAALAVLVGIADTQDYLYQEDMLKLD